MRELDAFAAAIAEPIDRIRISISNDARQQLLPVLGEYGITIMGGQVIGILRNLGPTRRITRGQLDAVFVYQPQIATEGVPDLARAGLLDVRETIGLTTEGVGVIDRVLAACVESAAQRWATVAADYDELLAIADSVIETALPRAGDALSVVAPVHLPDGIAARDAFAESLTPLRFIRFDAHVDAWRGEGLTAEQVQSLDNGELRDRIEARTNELAGAPYAVLTDREREALLTALQDLAPSA